MKRTQREALRGHKGLVVALTGLPAAGKTTLACLVEAKLTERGGSVIILDGDALRQGLCADLGFGPAERGENLRRLGQVARIILEAGVVVLIAAIMPHQVDRERLKGLFAPQDFLEVFVSCDLAICQQRDPKGHYAEARQGLLANFTGISAPYEEPCSFDLCVHTDRERAQEGAQRIADSITSRIWPCQGLDGLSPARTGRANS